MSSLAHTSGLSGGRKIDGEPSQFITVRALDALGRWAEQRGWWLFAALSAACGWLRLGSTAARNLGHDELFTYYIAQAPTLRQLFKLTQTVDLHPPLSYLLVRASFALFGPSTWSCRLPFAIAFFCAAAFLYLLVQRLLSPLHGLIAVLFLWSNPSTYQADEARPYSLILCFTALMLVSWHRAVDSEGNRTWALAALAASGSCLLLSHVLGALPYAMFLGAEVVRLVIRRKPDWQLWLAFTLPSFAALTYIPLLHTHSTLLFAREYRVTPLRVFSLYWESFRYVATPVLVIVVIALGWPVIRKRRASEDRAIPSSILLPLGFLLTGLAAIPLSVGFVFSRTGTAFFDRYGIVWLLPLALAPTLLLGCRTRRNSMAGVCVALVLAAALFFNTMGKAWLLAQLSSIAPSRVAIRLSYVVTLFPIYAPQENPPVPAYIGASLATAPLISNLETLEPDLPLVANTGLSFLELDHQEPAQVAKRLYLLTDEQASAAIAHDTVFAHYERLTDVFPIRGTVEPYCKFLATHQRFLVIGAYNHPQGWLLRKLDQDGAKLEVLGTCKETYENCQIYKVSATETLCPR